MVENVVVDVESDNIREVAWSMDQAQLFSIAGLLNEADRFYFLGDYQKCFVMFQNIKFRIIPNLSVEERKVLNDLELEFNFSFLACCLSRDKEELSYKFHNNPKLLNYCNKIISVGGDGLRTNIDSYRVMIMDLLQKYGYLAKMKKDSTLMNT